MPGTQLLTGQVNRVVHPKPAPDRAPKPSKKKTPKLRIGADGTAVVRLTTHTTFDETTGARLQTRGLPKTITDDASAPRSVLGPGLEDANAAYVAAVQARLAQTADLDKAENKARVKEKHLKGRVKDRNDRLELEGSEEDGSSDSGLSEEEESEGETDQSDDDEEEEMDEDEDEEDEESDEEFVSSSVATSSKRRRTEDKAPSKRRKREEVAAVGSIPLEAAEDAALRLLRS